MIYLNGIHLLADDINELHETARKLSISKSYYQAETVPHYDVICPFKIKAILKIIGWKRN